MIFKTEQDLAREVINMLREWHWDVYQEVVGHGGRCDIVAKRDNILWAIECKMGFGLAVLEQAHNWLHRAHYVSVATARAPGGFGAQVCRHYGIGAISFRGENYYEAIRPRLNRKIQPITLHEEQKSFCDAGSCNGGHWTKFKRTVRNLVTVVRNNPGIEFNQAIKEIDHHYSSLGTAKSCLRGYIGTVIPELRCEIVNRKLCVYLAKEDDQP